MALGSSKEGFTFDGSSWGQSLKRTAPLEGPLLGVLRVGFGKAAPEKMLSGC